MKKLIILVLFVAVHLQALKGQALDNRLDLSIGFGTGSFTGEKNYSEGSFVTTAFFPGFTSMTGLSVEGSYKVKKFLSAGVTLSHKTGSDWQSDGSHLYYNSRIGIISFAPCLLISTPYRETGLLNRFRFALRGAAVVGNATSTIEDNRIVIVGGPAAPDVSKDVYYGWEVGPSVQYRFTKPFGIYARYSYSQNRISSYLYPDNRFSFFQFEAGVLLQAKRAKQF